MSKRYFITGGNGYFGLQLAAYLLKKNCQVTLYDPVAPQFPLPPSPNCRWIQGDILDADLLRKSVEGHDIVIHNAALLPIARAQKIFQSSCGWDKKNP